MKSDLRKRVESLNESINGSEHEALINEGSGAPDKSIYGAVGKVAMPDLHKILKKHVPSKYVKFKNYDTAGLGLWLIEFKGYSRSDLEVSGWVSLAAPGGVIKSWSVELDFVDAAKGRVQEQYDFATHEDWTKVFTDTAKRLKQWVEL